jgi:sortase A
MSRRDPSPQGPDARRIRLLRLAVVLLAVLGAGLMVYPFAAQTWNRHIADRTLAGWQEAVQTQPQDQPAQALDAARAYNAGLVTEHVPDAFAVRDGIRDQAYEALLNPDGSGLMAELKIPAIRVDLPVYHYTYDEVLKKGCGHLFGSALPVGGAGTHCVVSAHRGLPSMRLFTDLDQVQPGDRFYFVTEGQTLAYEVDQIKTVAPNQTQDLAVVPGQDLATLMTCTPYGINTDRLLVRGHRVAYTPQEEEEVPARFNAKGLVLRALAAGAGVAAAALIMLALHKWTGRRRAD